MRLVSARVRGAGRLLDLTIKLDQKLVAIVGTNEVGKSTLLKSLAYVAASDALTPANISDATPVVSLPYFVSDANREELEDLRRDAMAARRLPSPCASRGSKVDHVAWEAGGDPSWGSIPRTAWGRGRGDG